MTKKTTTSPTGAESGSRAWTRGVALFEVLLCVVLLSVGLVAVYRPLLAAVTVLHHAECRLTANRLMEDKLWGMEEKLRRQKQTSLMIKDDVVTHGSQVFHHRAQAFPVSPDQKLLLLKSTIWWKGAAKTYRVTRDVYVLAA
jgi:Tfp pilus assembly protein PilV